jgi:7-carboxy-7-deazaguanine synthase
VNLKVIEIYESIQGESTWAGLPCTFVRLAGCPLRCRWCDSTYTFKGGERISLNEILAQVNERSPNLVEITGGEPLVHGKRFVALCEALLKQRYEVLVETSGSLSIQVVPQQANVIMDIKCPDSGESGSNLWSNVTELHRRASYKRANTRCSLSMDSALLGRPVALEPESRSP